MDGLFTDMSLTAPEFINSELHPLSLSSDSDQPELVLLIFINRAVNFTPARPPSPTVKKRKKKYSHPMQTVTVIVNLLLKDGLACRTVCLS